MGDRANIVIGEEDEQVCLYTHWDGTDLPNVLKDALYRGESRWTDFQYLTRIIFCEMLRHEAPDDTTGFGITQNVHDGEASTITISVPDQTIQINKQTPVSFEQYIKNPNPSWREPD